MFDNELLPLQRTYNGSRLKFLVLGRADIRTITPDVPYIVISITDPDKPDAEIAESPYKRAVLRLKFDDATYVDVPGLEGFTLGNSIELTEVEADAILAFVKINLNTVEMIICQCEAGVSRSAGVAAALSWILQDDDDFFFAHYCPNRRIYHTILDAAKKLSPEK